MKQELYLSCTKCGGVPEWDEETRTANGFVYKFNGVCPLCGGTEFDVIEIKPKDAKSGSMEILNDPNTSKDGDDSAVRLMPENRQAGNAVGDSQDR